ncbi:MAG: VOC family protein [Acidobacteria bacterium]|nr:VOC family protein [Acidobacteriota bacterium]
MTIQLDHFMVPARDKAAAARMLAELLGVPWAEANAGPFCSVFVNDGLTIDFDETPHPFPVHHCAFRVEQAAFDAILARIRAAGLPYRSTPNGPVDMQVNTHHGGSTVYWDAPDGHYWELLTVSYARKKK